MFFLQTIDPSFIAGDNALIWGCVVVIGALSTTVAFLAKRLFVKSDEFVNQHQDLLKENLLTLISLTNSLDRLSLEVPRMSTEVKEKLATEAGITRSTVAAQIERLKDVLEK